MNKKQEIVVRVRIGFLAICLVGAAILARAFYIQSYQGNYYLSLADSLTISKIKLPAERGNIYANDGRLLATTLPIFDLGFDIKASLRNDKLFRAHVDSLALLFSNKFKDKSAAEYKKELWRLHRSKKSYVVLRKGIPYDLQNEMQHWPLLRNGQNKSGFVFDKHKKRLKPFGWLAERTIGYYKENSKEKVGVGLEKKFDTILTGIPGNTLAQKISGGLRIPLESPENVRPQPGKDVHTSIDIDFQDVAEDALNRALLHHGAEHGCVVLMECKTGKIRVIANLGLTKDSIYKEIKNYALAEAEAPGSTFKIATVAALLEDGYANNQTKVDLGNGTAIFYGLPVRDHDVPKTQIIDLKRAIEISSNVAIAELADKFYNTAQGKQKLFQHLESFGFTQPIDIEIEGAAKPILRNYKKWQATSVPFLAHGYEMQVTPLHILSFYNAIANNGIMVKPSLIEKITAYNQTVDSFTTVVLNKKLLSAKTIVELRQMLEGVVENGTATNLKTDYLRVAGKTGTAKIAQGKEGYKKAVYQASFCGYFPAENPLYSMIVVINSPSQNGYYGNKVAGSIFKEVADKVYSKSLQMQKPVQQLIAQKEVPIIKKGNSDEIKNIYAAWGKKIQTSDQEWTQVSRNQTVLQPTDFNVKESVMPEVVGMGLRDVLYLLENMGLKVNIVGQGMVKSQSIKAGEPIVKGTQVVIELS